MNPGGKVSRFFQRNHQKVKLVDDCQFVGSLNVDDSYSTTRYGSGEFRDLNTFIQGHPTKSARDIFRDMLLRNVDHYPEKLSKSTIEDQFAHFDEVFKSLDSVSIEKNIECKLIQEQPPNKTEISAQVLNMIKTADSHIRIIQPYVQNIDELEDRLIEAMEKRGV